jgi:hypothetical protein
MLVPIALRCEKGTVWSWFQKSFTYSLPCGCISLDTIDCSQDPGVYSGVVEILAYGSCTSDATAAKLSWSLDYRTRGVIGSSLVVNLGWG